MTIDELLKEERELNERLNAIRQIKFEKQDEILATIAAESDIQFISITGFTPGFNDGEPCTHSSMVGYNHAELDAHGYIDVIEDRIGDGSIDSLDPKQPVSERVKELLYMLEDNTTWKHETNYRVTWFREDNKFVGGELEEYWCGY